MAALAGPYDPAQNAPFRVNDLSYFEGRYYLYMGPAPALTVFIPARLLTGRYVTERTACSLLCLIGAVASVALVSGIRKRWLPAAPAAVLVAAALALAFADGYYVAARGTIAQQVAIANAYAFGMLALWACGRGLSSARRPAAWFAVAGLLHGRGRRVAPQLRLRLRGPGAAALPMDFSKPARRPAELWGAVAPAPSRWEASSCSSSPTTV